MLSKLQHDVTSLHHYYLKIISITSMLVMPVMALFVVFAEPLILTLLTDKWLPAVQLMQILVFVAIWAPFSALNINIICVVGRSDYVLKIELFKGLLRIAAILLSMPYGLAAVCYALVAVSFLSSFVYTGHTKHSVGVGWLQQTRCMVPYILMSAAASLVAYVLSCLLSMSFLKLLAGIVAFVVVYVLLLLRFDRQNMVFLKSLVPRRHKEL